MTTPATITRDQALYWAQPHLERLYLDWLRQGRADVVAFVARYRSSNGGGSPAPDLVAASVDRCFGSVDVAAYHLRCMAIKEDLLAKHRRPAPVSGSS